MFELANHTVQSPNFTVGALGQDTWTQNGEVLWGSRQKVLAYRLGCMLPNQEATSAASTHQ